MGRRGDSQRQGKECHPPNVLGICSYLENFSMSHLLSFLSYLLVSPAVFPHWWQNPNVYFRLLLFSNQWCFKSMPQPPSLDLVVQPQGLHIRDFWAGLTWSLPGDADAA